MKSVGLITKVIADAVVEGMQRASAHLEGADSERDLAKMEDEKKR